MNEDKRNWMIRIVVNNLTAQQVDELVDKLCALAELDEASVQRQPYEEADHAALG